MEKTFCPQNREKKSEREVAFFAVLANEGKVDRAIVPTPAKNLGILCVLLFHAGE